ncbi:PREDICTED: uncharacterized protein LOC109126879 [Camelina sativa]|uniref:Uncharacterized protein LOC109126879 n=1 Tax=Camelina sativa TaxID=90675 RepID=A0ABM1QHS9_CAMSA|nr:PREDICTED: uncharacterized protein LOC109126879 [Camelina sativa]
MDDIDLDNLPHDPGERKAIIEYHPNQRDEVRRKYWIRGPCQPRSHTFEQRLVGNTGNTLRRFNPSWFDQYSDWLEYSVKTKKAYCLCCYLFRDKNKAKGRKIGFVTEGFNCWNKSDRFSVHVGKEINSFHNIAKKKCEDLFRQGQSIKHALHKKTNVMKDEYRVRLNTSVDASRYLMRQGLPFCGHDETMDSSNRGIFLELVKYTAEQNEVKEQMATVFRFVEKNGIVKERFVGLIHVLETCSLSLKSGIDSLFSKYSLSLKQLRGQGYDGAANMRVAKKHFEVGDFFDKVYVLVNVLIASCKRKDLMREIQRGEIEKGISSGEIKTGKGLNKES